MPIRRPLTVVVAALGALLATALPAWAHAAFDVTQLPAGAREDVELRVPIEIDSTNAFVDVLVPAGWVVEDCAGADGWTCETDARDSGETVVNLSADSDDAGGVELFTLSLTAPDEQGTYGFPVVQTYADGTEAPWIADPGEERAAPTVQVGDDDTPVERSSELPEHDTPEDDPSAGASADADAAEEPQDEESTDDAADDGSAPSSATDGAADPTESPGEAAPDDEVSAGDDASEDAVTDEADDPGSGGVDPLVLGVIALVVVGIVAAAIAGRRSDDERA